MHPAFSVIFFSTLTGLGYGVWVWTALNLLTRRVETDSGTITMLLLAAAAVPVTAGLLSSTLHLGRPLRAWRAFSQWRTSWLSREGVAALLAFVPWAVVVGAVFLDVGGKGPWLWIALVALVVLSLATVACTAMIYASLKPVPAWTHRTVLPAYLVFALLTGGLVSEACIATAGPGGVGDVAAVFALLMLANAILLLKRSYWRDLDRGDLPASRNSALGLPADREATVFDHPHTEASYLTKEMGFVVARKHSLRLRRVATILFGWIPAVACIATLWWPPVAAPALAFAAVSALLGALVERWLFFAEAKHLVMLYY